MGIKVFESIPADAELLNDEVDEVEADADEVAAVLASSVDTKLYSTDPLRMYMREMGSVELLTRRGEIAIAKRIEEGTQQVLKAVAYHLGTVKHILEQY